MNSVSGIESSKMVAVLVESSWRFPILVIGPLVFDPRRVEQIATTGFASEIPAFASHPGDGLRPSLYAKPDRCGRWVDHKAAETA
jgi:hypothetical protein